MRFKRDGKEYISIKEIKLNDGTIIGVFEGNRGANPDHDILIKYQESGKRLRTPKHIHWVIDLLIKKEHNKKLTLEFMKYLRDMYNKVESFKNKEDRKKCILKETTKEMSCKHCGFKARYKFFRCPHCDKTQE